MSMKKTKVLWVACKRLLQLAKKISSPSAAAMRRGWLASLEAVMALPKAQSRVVEANQTHIKLPERRQPRKGRGSKLPRRLRRKSVRRRKRLDRPISASEKRSVSLYFAGVGVVIAL